MRPNLMRSEERVLAGYLIVEIDGVAESKWPEVAFVVLQPTKGSIDHHPLGSTNSALDGVFRDSIVVISSHA
jgi:hypothetical protein